MTDTAAFEDAVEELCKVVNHHLAEGELSILNPAPEQVHAIVRAAARDGLLDDDEEGAPWTSRTSRSGCSGTPYDAVDKSHRLVAAKLPVRLRPAGWDA